jgi:hypothetical protein
MLAHIARLFEADDVPMPRHRVVTAEPGHTGMLSLSEGHDRELRRAVGSAYLRCQDTGNDILPPVTGCSRAVDRS